MEKSYMIELMLLDGRISAERAEFLATCCYDIVEAAWFDTLPLEGAFDFGSL